MYTFFIGFIFYDYCIVSCEGVRMIIYYLPARNKSMTNRPFGQNIWEVKKKEVAFFFSTDFYCVSDPNVFVDDSVDYALCDPLVLMLKPSGTYSVYVQVPCNFLPRRNGLIKGFCASTLKHYCAINYILTELKQKFRTFLNIVTSRRLQSKY